LVFLWVPAWEFGLLILDSFGLQRLMAAESNSLATMTLFAVGSASS
jgi:hypothetical protein